MKKISSDIGKYSKYIFLFMVIFLFAFPSMMSVLVSMATFDDYNNTVVGLLNQTILSLLLIIIPTGLLWPLADDVFEESGALLLKRRTTILRIPYSAIKSMKFHFWLGPIRVALYLKKPCDFGKKISFIPATPPSLKEVILAAFHIKYLFADILKKRIKKAQHENQRGSSPRKIERLSTEEYAQLLAKDRDDKYIQRPAAIPEELKGWNWGGFFLTWIWGIGNRSFITFLAFIPVFGFFVTPFIAGALGNRWAWDNREWESSEQFKTNQRKWARAGLLFWTGLAFIYWVISVLH